MRQSAEAQTVFDLVASLLFLIIVLVDIENPVYCNIVYLFFSLKISSRKDNEMLQIHLKYVKSQSVNLFIPSLTIRQR